MRNLAILTLLAASSAQAVDGVDPRVYLQARKPVPEAVRELKSAPIELSVRILREGADAFLVDTSAYPKGADVASMRVLEKRALVIGAIHAVAARKPADARALLEAQLAATDALVRAEAADQLGQLGDATIPALVTAARSDADGRVREAAVAGLAKVRSESALEALAPFVLDATDKVRQEAAVRSLAVLGSKWAWQARGDVATGERLRAEARALLTKLERTATVDAVMLQLR